MNSSSSSAEDGPKPESTTEPGHNRPLDRSSPQLVRNASATDIAHFVSTIKNIEQQVGEHVIAALQHVDTVAVITSVVIGPDGQQRIVSAALNPARAAQVDALLRSAVDEREDEELCFGFHCLVKPKGSVLQKNGDKKSEKGTP